MELDGIVQTSANDINLIFFFSFDAYALTDVGNDDLLLVLSWSTLVRLHHSNNHAQRCA